MIVSPPIPISPVDLIDRMHANAPHERSTGLHQSQIIKSLCTDLEPERFDPSKPMDMTRVETGFAFEHILERGLAARHPGLIRPGEVECDGISGSPDGLDIAVDPWLLYEFKATWMSIGDGIQAQKFRHWIWQIKGYLYMLKLRHARLIALFVRGHYKWEDAKVDGVVLPSGPLLLQWDFEFTENELVMNWGMLIRHARQKGML